MYGRLSKRPAASCDKQLFTMPAPHRNERVIRIFPMTRFLRPLLAAFVIAGLGSSLPAAAQSGATGTVKSQHGSWAVVCDEPAGATGEQCALLQNVVAEDRPEVGLSIVALKTADQQARILRILAPLGILLPNGLGLYVDGKDIGRAQFVRCFQDGCYAEVILADELLTTLSAGKTATFIVFQTPEQGIGIPVDLTGFKEGFAALP